MLAIHYILPTVRVSELVDPVHLLLAPAPAPVCVDLGDLAMCFPFPPPLFSA
jgi:hypothetical protein